MKVTVKQVFDAHAKLQERIDRIQTGVRSQVSFGEWQRPGSAFFTGLKAWFKDVASLQLLHEGAEVEVESLDDKDLRMVGQWVWYDPDRARDRNFYVCVPAMTHGTMKQGDIIEIGESVFDFKTPISEIIEKIRNGRALLDKIVKEGLNA